MLPQVESQITIKIAKSLLTPFFPQLLPDFLSQKQIITVAFPHRPILSIFPFRNQKKFIYFLYNFTLPDDCIQEIKNITWAVNTLATQPAVWFWRK